MSRRVSLGAAAVAAMLFAMVAAAVTAGLTRQIDDWALAAARLPGTPHDLAGPRWDLPLLLAVTTLGTWVVRGSIAAAAAVVLVAVRRGREAAVIAVAFLFGALLLPLLKAHYARPRPDIAWRLAQETSLSFPSGHALGTMLLFPLVGAAAGRGVGHARAGAAIGVALALGVGVTRVLLGVHWASDVAAGWLAGGCVALAAAAFVRARA